MGDEPTMTGPQPPPRGSYAGSIAGLAIVALCGLMMFWLMFLPIVEPDPRKVPVFIGAREAVQISYFFLTIGAGFGWLIFWLSGRQRRLAAASASRERVKSSVARVLMCALGLSWMLVALFGAFGGSALGPDGTAFVAFLSITPVGFLLWHVGYATRERDRRRGSHYPLRRGVDE